MKKLHNLVSMESGISIPLFPQELVSEDRRKERRRSIEQERRFSFQQERRYSNGIDISNSTSTAGTPPLHSLFSSVDTSDYDDLLATLHENNDDSKDTIIDIPLTIPLPLHQRL
jgi:hypothetical protein